MVLNILQYTRKPQNCKLPALKEEGERGGGGGRGTQPRHGGPHL